MTVKDRILSPDVQNLIRTVMRRTDLEAGVGYYTTEDVRAHLQEVALTYSAGFDSKRGVKLTTFLWQRLFGAAIQLIRKEGSRTRDGRLRQRPLSLDQEVRLLEEETGGGASAGSRAVGLSSHRISGQEMEELVIAERDADLALELSRLPPRMRLVLYLLFYEGAAPSTAATRLAMTVSCVRELRDAALQKLRLRLLRNGS